MTDFKIYTEQIQGVQSVDRSVAAATLAATINRRLAEKATVIQV